MPASLHQRALLGALGAFLGVALPLEALAGASSGGGSRFPSRPDPSRMAEPLLAQGLFGLDSETIYSGIRAVNLAATWP